MLTCSFLLIAAILLDAVLGDPVTPLHPVRLIGKTIQRLEPPVRRLHVPPLWQGVLFTLLVLGIWEALLFLVFRITTFFVPLKFLFFIFVLYSCLALRDLTGHVHPVLDAMEEQNLALARERLQMIVGRETAVLDEGGILRAAIETAAEGYVDGFLAPVFWFALFCVLGKALGNSPSLTGTAGILGYRVVNTLDSMIGYKNETYLFFGRFAARLDDVVNYVPARLSVLFLFLSAWILRRDAGKGLESVVRYHHHAASPNAGYPESFVAGAFQVQLGGPVQYPFGRVDKPMIGDGILTPTPETVRQVCRLVTLSGYLAIATFAIFLPLLPFVDRIHF